MLIFGGRPPQTELVVIGLDELPPVLIEAELVLQVLRLVHLELLLEVVQVMQEHGPVLVLIDHLSYLRGLVDDGWILKQILLMVL